METLLPFFLALSVGFTHAFEADHLVAVSNIVTQRQTLWLSLKDGVFWGLGHTSTILLVGSVFILGRLAAQEGVFRYLEAGVGIMLVVLGGVRLSNVWPRPGGWQPHGHSLVSEPSHSHDKHPHRLAYSVGLMHGLAGSGALLLSVLTQVRGAGAGLLYLVSFGAGSIVGMMVAASAFSIPFSAKLVASPRIRTALIIVSSVLCVVLGIHILYENLSSH